MANAYSHFGMIGQPSGKRIGIFFSSVPHYFRVGWACVQIIIEFRAKITRTYLLWFLIFDLLILSFKLVQPNIFTLFKKFRPVL